MDTRVDLPMGGDVNEDLDLVTTYSDKTFAETAAFIKYHPDISPQMLRIIFSHHTVSVITLLQSSLLCFHLV